MPPSNRTINYRLRPAKAVERKMMCEALSRLSVLYPVDRFQYVGYGSTSFADFTLVHRVLGISDMVSIERQVASEKRFRLNAPFGCIAIKFGESNDVLPDVNLSKPTIMWLDDDQRLTSRVIRDVEYAISTLRPPSAFVVSVNASPWNDVFPDPAIGDRRLQRLKDDVGASRVPANLSGADLAAWGTAKAYHRILDGVIRDVVADRSVAEPLSYRQIFHFCYQDGAKMLTVGGLLLHPSDGGACESTGLSSLFFVRDASDAFHIRVPVLTFREMRHLDQLLPHDRHLLDRDLFPESDVEEYAAIYRYFPSYAETDL